MKRIAVLGETSLVRRVRDRFPDIAVDQVKDAGRLPSPNGIDLYILSGTTPELVPILEQLSSRPCICVSPDRSAHSLLERGADDVVDWDLREERLPGSIGRSMERVKNMERSRKQGEEVSTLRKRNRRLNAEVKLLGDLGSVVRTVTSSLYIEEILTSILSGLKKALSLDQVVLGLVSGDPPREEIKLAMGIDGSISKAEWPFEATSHIWQDLKERKRPILVDPRKQKSLPEFVRAIFQGDFLKVPMVVKGEILGTIMCARDSKRIGRSEFRILGTFAEYSAIAIQNAKLYFDVLQSESELREAQQKLVTAEKMAIVGHMAVGINHEINNPLCNISLIAQTIAEKLPDRPKLQGLLGNINDNVGRIQKVTRKISSMTNAQLTEYLPNQMMVDLQ